MEQEFVVLSVDCYLGADFLTKHFVMIDFKRNALKLAGHGGAEIQIEVPARTLTLLEAILSEGTRWNSSNAFQEGSLCTLASNSVSQTYIDI